MNDRYEGLGQKNRAGCLTAGAVGILVLVFDLGRFFGDPAPGTEDLWWRHIPVLIPTFVIVAATFFITKALIRSGKSDDR
jgi:amino acid permease